MATEFILGKSKSGNWEVRWSEFDQERGRWISRTVSTRTKNRADAVAFKAAWVEGLKEEAVAAVKGAEPTLGSLIDDYVEHHLAANRKAPAQAQSLMSPKAILGHRLVGELDAGVLAAYRVSRNRSDGTLRRELGAIVAVLNWASEPGRPRRIAKDTIPKIDLPPEGQARETFLDETEEAIFHAEAMGASIGLPRLSRVTRFVAIALDTAARKSAIETLTWDRVDFRSGLIDFRDPARHATKKRRATVPISARLRPLLDRAYRERIDDYVIDAGAIRKHYALWVARSSFPHVTPHDLRRTWATLAARAGVPLWDVAQVLGDTMGVVLKHYAVHQPGHLKSAIDARWS